MKKVATYILLMAGFLFIILKYTNYDVKKIVKSTLQSSQSIYSSGAGLDISTVDLPIRLKTNNVSRWMIQPGNGYLLGEQVSNFIGVNTQDGNDSGVLSLSGSSVGSTSRGASISLYGNESKSINRTYHGDVHIFAGDGGQVWIGYHDPQVGAQDAIGVKENGNVGIFKSLSIGVPGVYASPDNPSSRLVVKGVGDTSKTSALNVTDSSGKSLLFIRDDGAVSVSGGSANKVVCWKSDGVTLGYCTSQPDTRGACTCN